MDSALRERDYGKVLSSGKCPGTLAGSMRDQYLAAAAQHEGAELSVQHSSASRDLPTKWRPSEHSTAAEQGSDVNKQDRSTSLDGSHKNLSTKLHYGLLLTLVSI